jgi:sigma-70-like protein
MSCLSERDRELISLYYEQELTMRKIGDRLGIDESRVSQIHSGALLRLQTRVRAMLRPSRPSVPPAYVVAELRKQSAPLEAAGQFLTTSPDDARRR